MKANRETGNVARKGTEKAPGTGHLRYLGVSRGNLESFKSCRGHYFKTPERNDYATAAPLERLAVPPFLRQETSALTRLLRNVSSFWL